MAVGKEKGSRGIFFFKKEEVTGCMYAGEMIQKE
jgi:hypothetical protein